MDETPGTMRSATFAPAWSWDCTFLILTPLLLSSNGATNRLHGSIALADEQEIAPSGASLSGTHSSGAPSGWRIGVIHVDQAKRARRPVQLYRASLLAA